MRWQTAATTPGASTLAVGVSMLAQALAVTNNGGESHTFTKVEVFGGGGVELLNGPLGLSTVDECSFLRGPGTLPFSPPGQSRNVAQLALGTHRFQCCIHPWMHLTLQVRGR